MKINLYFYILRDAFVMEKSLNVLYEECANQAEIAHSIGTFAVGGMMVEKASGQVLRLMHNNVIRNGRVLDPTAHVERQLIDWYFEEIRKGANFPAPQDCLIISSLDPCLMCGGSAMAAGFEVVTANLDPFVSMNWNGDMTFPAVPENLRAKAQETFSYFGVDGVREFQGTLVGAFAGCVDLNLVDRLDQLFLSSAQNIRDTIGSIAGQSTQINHVRISEQNAKELEILARTAELEGNARQAGMLISQEGKILFAAKDQTAISPILTPLMLTMRGYMSQVWQNTNSDYKFPHPKYCIYLQYEGPRADAKSLADLGAFGSTIEGKIPEGTLPFQFLNPGMGQNELALLLQNLPPFYKDVVGVKPVQCEIK